MEISFEKDRSSLTKRYGLSPKEMEIMKFVHTNGRIDFHELKYGEQNPKDETNTFFYEECWELMAYKFIEEDNFYFHSFVLADLGKQLVEDNPLFV